MICQVFFKNNFCLITTAPRVQWPGQAGEQTFAYLIDGSFSHHIPHTPYRQGALAHIYIPQSGEVPCGGFIGNGLLALVGTLSFRVAFPPPDVFIIAHFVLFVKRFLKKIATFFQRLFPIHYGCGCDTPSFRSCIPMGLDSNLSSALPS